MSIWQESHCCVSVNERAAYILFIEGAKFISRFVDRCFPCTRVYFLVVRFWYLSSSSAPSITFFTTTVVNQSCWGGITVVLWDDLIGPGKQIRARIGISKSTEVPFMLSTPFCVADRLEPFFSSLLLDMLFSWLTSATIVLCWSSKLVSTPAIYSSIIWVQFSGWFVFISVSKKLTSFETFILEECSSETQNALLLSISKKLSFLAKSYNFPFQSWSMMCKMEVKPNIPISDIVSWNPWMFSYGV